MKIQDILKSKENWTQGTYARNKDGDCVPHYDTNAVCWCLIGAACRADVYTEQTQLNLQAAIAAKGGDYGDIVRWNDNPNRTFEEVQSLIKELDL